jgi:hypothetical protein
MILKIIDSCCETLQFFKNVEPSPIIKKDNTEHFLIYSRSAEVNSMNNLTHNESVHLSKSGKSAIGINLFSFSI